MEVKISEILALDARKREINRVELNEITFLDDNGNPVKIDPAIVEKFRFIGLNNTDFITTGFYERGFDD